MWKKNAIFARRKQRRGSLGSTAVDGCREVYPDQKRYDDDYGSNDI